MDRCVDVLGFNPCVEHCLCRGVVCARSRLIINPSRRCEPKFKRPPLRNGLIFDKTATEM
jgi:hypothetical protein